MSPSLRPILGVLALLLVLAFAFQGTRGLWEPDEGRYAAAGLHMQQGGDWLVPSVDGQHPHLTKPPLTYWLLASSFALLGPNEWAARLPGAVSFVLTGLLVYGIGRRLCPGKPWLPALVWATSLAPTIAANVVSTDPLLALFETAAMYAFVEYWSREGGDARRWAALMWLAWGLAFLTKGPPGLLPLAAVVAFLAVHERGRLKPLFRPEGLLLFVLVAFSWFAIVVAQQPDRLGYFLGAEVYDRVFTAAHDRNSQWYGAFEVYVPVLLIGTLPWGLLALVAAGGPRAAWQRCRSRLREGDRHAALLAWWLLVPLAVFFLARSRLQLYVLPLFVPLALASARMLSESAWGRGDRFARTLGFSAGLLLLLKGTLAYWPSDRDAREIAAQLRRMVDPAGVEALTFVGMRPFYGLFVYLGVPVRGLEIDEGRYEYSTRVTPQTLCAAVRDSDRVVYGVKSRRAQAFLDHLAPCRVTATQFGVVHADGADIEFYGVAATEDDAPAISR